MGINIGDPAPDFDLPGIDGRRRSLKSTPASAVAVIFSCNHCPYVKAYEDRMIGIQQKFAQKEFQILAINSNDAANYPEDSFERMAERAKDKKFNFPYLYDETQEIARAYGAARTPHVYLLDQGRVVRYIGAIDDSWEYPERVKKPYLNLAIEALLAGKLPSPQETFPVGCTIKWRR